MRLLHVYVRMCLKTNLKKMKRKKNLFLIELIKSEESKNTLIL